MQAVHLIQAEILLRGELFLARKKCQHNSLTQKTVVTTTVETLTLHFYTQSSQPTSIMTKQKAANTLQTQLSVDTAR